MVIYQDTGFATPELEKILLKVIDQGGTVLSFIGPELADSLKRDRPASVCSSIPSSPMDVVGYQCRIGRGSLYYAHIPIYDVFNTDFYFLIHDAKERRQVIDRILFETQITPHIRFKDGGDRTVLFARTNPAESELWITAKTSRHDGFSGQIQWTDAISSKTYSVTDVLSGQAIQISGQFLAQNGFLANLGDSESKVYFVKPLAAQRAAR